MYVKSEIGYYAPAPIGRVHRLSRTSGL